MLYHISIYINKYIYIYIYIAQLGRLCGYCWDTRGKHRNSVCVSTLSAVMAAASTIRSAQMRLDGAIPHPSSELGPLTFVAIQRAGNIQTI